MSRINDFLTKVTDLKDIKRIKFDMESPRFNRARLNLNIEVHDLIRKKFSQFKDDVLNEQPKLINEPAMVKDLANIRYSYHCNTFKESFNDILDERKRICDEEENLRKKL